jgi:hypothetical protein
MVPGTTVLKPCKDCGQEVSTKALTCPHCGRLRRRVWSLGWPIRLALFLLSLWLLYKYVLPVVEHALGSVTASLNR